ncbi:hypothetical protein SMICM17S_07594 [Streptomyces microflavus]
MGCDGLVLLVLLLLLGGVSRRKSAPNGSPYQLR